MNKSFFHLVVGFFCFGFVLSISHPAFSGCMDENKGNYKEMQKCLNGKSSKFGSELGAIAGTRAGEHVGKQVPDKIIINQDKYRRRRRGSTYISDLFKKRRSSINLDTISNYRFESREAFLDYNIW